MRKNCVWRDCSCKGPKRLLARANYEYIGLAIEKDRIYLTPNGGWFPLKCTLCGQVGTIVFGPNSQTYMGEQNEIKN